MLKKIFAEHIWHNLKKSKLLVYNITNYVTANDCANILLAVGGSPIMSDAVEEAEDLGSVHIKSESKIKAREIVEIKIESSLS